jgi:hypothetical protein
MFSLGLITNTQSAEGGNVMISTGAVLMALIPSLISAYFIWKKYESVLFSMLGFFATTIFICLFYIIIYLFMQ